MRKSSSGYVPQMCWCFPSVRDFGAGVVFEALATGAVPVVADFGGPGDIVNPEVGYKVPLTNESDFVAQMEKILTELAHNRDLLKRLRRQGMAYVRESLTWEAKAQSHYSGSALGCTARPETGLSPAKDVSGRCWFHPVIGKTSK